MAVIIKRRGPPPEPHHSIWAHLQTQKKIYQLQHNGIWYVWKLGGATDTKEVHSRHLSFGEAISRMEREGAFFHVFNDIRNVIRGGSEVEV